MVPEKRKLMVVGAAIAAALALQGCAPAGYNSSNTGGGAEPASNNVDATGEPTAEPTGEPTGEPTDEPTGEPTDEPSPGETGEAGGKLSEDDITGELTGTKVKRMGNVVVNGEGFVLYRFDGDKVKPKVVSTCTGECAQIWPPAITADGKPELTGVDPKDVGTVTRPDGNKQLTIGDWPVYTYAGDKKPGQWKGQNVGAKWFVVEPDGTKNLTCLPPPSKPIAPPKDDEGDSPDNDSGDVGSTNYSY